MGETGALTSNCSSARDLTLLPRAKLPEAPTPEASVLPAHGLLGAVTDPFYTRDTGRLREIPEAPQRLELGGSHPRALPTEPPPSKGHTASNRCGTCDQPLLLSGPHCPHPHKGKRSPGFRQVFLDFPSFSLLFWCSLHFCHLSVVTWFYNMFIS